MNPAPLLRKAVVVDDDAMFADALATLIRLSGHNAEVVPVSTPRELARRILGCGPDTAFIDLGLAGIDGCDVASALRDLGCTAHLVAITGFVGAERARASRAAGFDEHWLKPIDPEAVERFLEQRSAARPSSQPVRAIDR